MAFRRPGIRILERDAAGDPTLAQVVPFSERVVATTEGPELLETFRRRPEVERVQLRPRIAPNGDGDEFRPLEVEPTEKFVARRPVEVQPVEPSVVEPVLRVGPFDSTATAQFFPRGFWTNASRPGVVVEGRQNVVPDRSPGWVWSASRPAVEPDEDGTDPGIGDAPRVGDGFPLGEQPPASETIAEKDAVSDGTSLPNGFAAGVGEQAFAGGGGGLGGSGSGGSVTVSLDPSTGRPLAGAARAGKLAMGVGAVVVVGILIARVRSRR